MIEERFSSTVNTEKMEVFNFRKVPSPRAAAGPLSGTAMAADHSVSPCARRGRARDRMGNGREATMMLQTNDADQPGSLVERATFIV